MSKKLVRYSEKIVRNIYAVRGMQVMLDSHLSNLYGVETKVLNQAVKRNAKRFPADFMFQINDTEWQNLKSQFVTSSVSAHGGARKMLNLFF
jgi:hypothetical protein